MDLLKDLNEEQRRAVEATDGAVLVLAGAGSGKTRVLVYRVAWLLETGRAEPDEIVAVTFTNKAADELKARVAGLVRGGSLPSRVGTFHSLCLRILRREATRLGYRDGFQVFDTDDSVRLVKECLKRICPGETGSPGREFLRRISSAKNKGVSVEQADSHWSGPRAAEYAAVYEAYQKGLRRMNAMDFDDLILNVLRLFREHPERRILWSGLTRYLLVDEYQDTNPPQYRLIRELSSAHGNLCVVGDEDQAIYRFRGADIGNILSFQDDFPDAQVLKLTRNYRSTGSILSAANSLVRNNRRRIGKDLWTEEGAGCLVRLTLLPGDREEATFVLQQLMSWQLQGGLEEASILYRTNAQSRLFEETLVRAGIPYRIYGSVRFYERREIRDLMAYLRLAVNPADDVSFRRVINLPARGIGAAAMMVIESAARGAGTTLYEGLEVALSGGALPARAANSVKRFREIVEEQRVRIRTASPGEVLRDLIDRIGYEEHLYKAEEAEAESRMENVAQLITAAEEAGPGDGLQEFLDRASLVSDSDRENVTGTRGVNLMTLHSAKGLEFDAVFLVGLEEGLLPHVRSHEDEEGIEEERRLCYVGMTRARKRLHLTAASQRRIYGEPAPSRLSRFVDEIDGESLEKEFPAVAEPAYRRAVARSGGGHREVSLGDEDISDHPDDDEFSAFRIGTRVRHESFGVGRVLQVEPASGGQKVTVQFRGGRTRKLLTQYARLTAVR